MSISHPPLLCRIASVNRPRVQRPGSDRAGAKDTSLPANHSRKNDRSRTNPSVGPSLNPLLNIGELGAVIIMGCAAEISVLRDNRMMAERYTSGIIYFGIRSDGHKILCCQHPRSPNLCCRINEVSVSNLRPEEAQNGCSPSEKRNRAQTKQKPRYQLPNQAAYLSAAGNVGRNRGSVAAES